MFKSINNAFGVLLVLVGLFVPSSTIVGFLRSKPVELLPQELKEQLLLGGMLFKTGLFILGLLFVAVKRMSLWKSGIQSEKHYTNTLGRSEQLTLAGILIAATLLRIYGLNYGLWYDEILTFVNYVRMPFGEIISTYNSENQHFLFNVLASVSFRLFGENIWTLRLPAVIFGVGSLWALFLFGRKITSVKESLLSVALLAFSYQHIWFSQNARGYTGLLFWTIISSLLFFRGLRETQTTLWLLYAVTTSLGIYTHMTMLFVVIGHFIIYYLFTSKALSKENSPYDKWNGFLFGFGLAGFLTFLLYAIVLPQIIGTIGEESAVTTWKNPLWTLLEMIKGLQVTFTGSIAVIAALIVFVIGLISFWRKEPLMILLSVIPPIIGTVAVISMDHPLWPRFFFFAVGFGALIVIRGTIVLGEFTGKLLNINIIKPSALGTLLSIILIFVSSVSIPYVYAPKQEYNAALDFVNKNKSPNDKIVTVGLATFPYRHFYKTDWEAAETLEELNAIRACSKRTWLLYTFPLHLEAEYPEIMKSIKVDFEIIEKFYGTLNGGTIFVCKSDKSLLKYQVKNRK